MSNATLWTATVWGQAKSAVGPASCVRKLKDGEEECKICRGDVPSSVSFEPCRHMVCFTCVENMRAKNIFKADKGVRCPFCRQFIEKYYAIGGSTGALDEILLEANRAAAIAAAARTPVNSAQPSVAIPAVEENENWLCGSCSNVNLWWREQCNRCGKANPRPKKSKDILKCNSEEVLKFVKEKLHPHLNKAFFEAGVPYCNGKVTGSCENIVNALKAKGEERLVKLLQVLSDKENVYDCATHFYGNYTIQDLIDATSKIRVATTSYQYMLDSFKADNGGRDFFGVLHAGLLAQAAKVSIHTQGTYVMQKVAELCNAFELLELCQRLFPDGPALCCDSKGVYVILKLLQQMSGKCDAEYRMQAAELAEYLCDKLHTSDKLGYLLHNVLGTKVLLEAIQVGLPRFGALKAGYKIATMSLELAVTKYGLPAVQGLLSLRSYDPSCDVILRDLVCLSAMNLQGHFTQLLVSEDERGCQLVQTCVQRLAEEQEISWIDAIIQELIGKGDIIVKHELAFEVLKFALSVNILDRDSVATHLQQLEELVGDITAVYDDIWQRISLNPPPPPPKYFAPSYIQPDLKYMLLQGYGLPDAPSPPNCGQGALVQSISVQPSQLDTTEHIVSSTPVADPQTYQNGTLFGSMHISPGGHFGVPNQNPAPAQYGSGQLSGGGNYACAPEYFYAAEPLHNTYQGNDGFNQQHYNPLPFSNIPAMTNTIPHPLGGDQFALYSSYYLHQQPTSSITPPCNSEVSYGFRNTSNAPTQQGVGSIPTGPGYPNNVVTGLVPNSSIQSVVVTPPAHDIPSKLALPVPVAIAASVAGSDAAMGHTCAADNNNMTNPAGLLELNPSGAAKPSSARPAAQMAIQNWRCNICTYEHMGAEADYLVCAVCGSEKGRRQL